MRRVLAALSLALALTACAQGGGGSDAGGRPPLRLDAAAEDAGGVDAGRPPRDPGTCTSYACPAGMTLTALGETARCARTIEAPPPAARRYCHFLASHGVLGFSWTSAPASYTCPTGMEYAPNGSTGYCLHRDVTPPDGFEADCDAFEASGVLAFEFPCEL